MISSSTNFIKNIVPEIVVACGAQECDRKTKGGVNLWCC